MRGRLGGRGKKEEAGKQPRLTASGRKKRGRQGRVEGRGAAIGRAESALRPLSFALWMDAEPTLKTGGGHPEEGLAPTSRGELHEEGPRSKSIADLKFEMALLISSGKDSEM